MPHCQLRVPRPGGTTKRIPTWILTLPRLTFRLVGLHVRHVKTPDKQMQSVVVLFVEGGLHLFKVLLTHPRGLVAHSGLVSVPQRHRT